MPGKQLLDDQADPDALRRYLAENPTAPDAVEIQRAIEQIEAHRAMAAGTPFALKTFLLRYPSSPLAIDVRQHLEEIEWRVATAAADEATLKAFLADWPSGVHAAEAREKLCLLRCQRLLKATNIGELERASRNQQLPCREALLEKAAELRWQQAQAKPGVSYLIAFLDRYPQSPRAAEARRAMNARRLSALLEAAQFDLAAEVAGQITEDSSLAEKVEQAREEWLALAFDTRGAQDSSAGKTLKQWWQMLRNNVGWFAPLREATAELRHIDEVNLEDEYSLPEDARQRWLLADRLGQLGTEKAAEILLGMCGDRYLEVRRRAARAFIESVSSMAEARALPWVIAQKGNLDRETASVAMPLRLALLDLAAGREQEALEVLRRGKGEEGEPDLFWLWLEVLAAYRAGERTHLTQAAADFSQAAAAFAEKRKRLWEEAQNESDRPWMVLRQLCGLWRMWRQIRDWSGETGDAAWKELKQCEAWLKATEERWRPQAPEYVTCQATEELPATASPTVMTALARLAVLPGAWTEPTLRWATCCHPQKNVRSRAAALRLQMEALEESGLLLPIWQLVAPLPAPAAFPQPSG